MSQFDLPRINFHGTALLDTATANNGNYEPGLTLFDQDESEVFLPPRCYLPSPFSPLLDPGIQVKQDKKGRSYVPISPITAENYQQWATTPLGSFSADSLYWDLYSKLKLSGNNPGYWNYYGDLSFSLINAGVTGITVYQPGNGVVTNTADNQPYCPTFLADMFGAEFSFNSNYFAQDSRTSAYLCDVDSIGQMCTQVFIGQSGLYKKDGQGNQVTVFSGTPVKSTARWMNLSKVLNYADHSLLPMGGSASFYAKIELNDGDELLNQYEQLTGKKPNGLFLKFMIHEVHEIREPDYSQIPSQTLTDVSGNQSGVQKNPATSAISGSITPYYDGDMTTASISRLMKNDCAVSIDASGIPVPVTKNKATLSIPGTVNLAPIQFVHDAQSNILSLDIMNSINEYGINPGTLPEYAGNGDIPAYQNFESYKYGAFILWFQPDIGGAPIKINSFDFENNYNMQQLLKTGGMIDFNVSAGADYSNGYFYLTLNGTVLFKEDDYLITSDQMGNYAQQYQSGNAYMSDGLPKIPCALRVFYRGAPVQQGNSLAVTQQTIDMRAGAITNTPNVMVYDGIPLNFGVDTDGSLTYGFIDPKSKLLEPDMSNLFSYIPNTSLIVVRTLSSEPQLADYLSGQEPITWDVVFNQVFSLYKTLYPVMDKIVPFTEQNWSDPFLLSKMKVLMSEDNWNKPLYMPVTRDLSAPQQQLLQMWADQINNPTSNK